MVHNMTFVHLEKGHHRQVKHEGQTSKVIRSNFQGHKVKLPRGHGIEMGEGNECRQQEQDNPGVFEFIKLWVVEINIQTVRIQRSTLIKLYSNRFFADCFCTGLLISSMVPTFQLISSQHYSAFT